MRKFIISISILLIIPATNYAGFNFGLIQATKKTGGKVDERVAQRKAINSQVPYSLMAVAVSGTQINISWTISSSVGIVNYKVYRNGNAIPITTTSNTTYNDTGLISLTVYSYQISACNSAGNCSPLSTTISATTQDTQAPTVPTDLTATPASSSQINLSWTASTDNIGVTSYKIYRDGGVTHIATPTGTAYNDTGLTTITSYSYTVSACDAASNCSAQSITTSTTTLDTQAPTIPISLTVVAVSSCQINLSWTASTDNVGVTSYKIYRDGGVTPTATPTGTTYNSIGLTAATPYSYTVSACDAAGNCSGQSSASSDTTAPLYPSAGGEWVYVPGNTTIGTSDFYVMKYEAKKAGGVATSQADIIPWGNINHANAIAACGALGAGYHLLTIPEVQTINRNIEAQATNWANGILGSLVSAGGGLKRGNIHITDSASYYSNDADYGTFRNPKAMLVLSNGGVLWDWSGNVNEWIYGAGSGGRLGAPGGITFTTGNYEWDSLTQERPIIGPSNSSWTRAYGMGSYTCGVLISDAVMRGGYWVGSAASGVFSFSTFDAMSADYASIGFRCGR